MAFILSILLLLLTACTPPPRSDQNRQKSSDMTAETESADELSAEVAVEHPTLVEDSHLLDRYPEEEFSAQDDDQDTETISAVPTSIRQRYCRGWRQHRDWKVQKAMSTSQR